MQSSLRGFDVVKGQPPFPTGFPVLRKALVSLCSVVLLLAPVPLSAQSAAEDAASQTQKIADLHVVDCLLPGVVRRLGNAQFQMPRRPVRTTASDCRIRGGEYTAYDRADYKTALSVWMPTAEAGDPEAQANVGEIFERGLGGEPNYQAALIWYRKAAQQGNSRAQFNLGTLYEQGLGVEENKLEALNWYRKAWGLPQDSVVFQSAAREEIEQLKKELTGAISMREKRIQKLEGELKSLEAQLAENDEQNQEQKSELKSEVLNLRDWIESLEEEKADSVAQLGQLKLREPTTVEPTATNIPEMDPADFVKAKGLDFGRYYALVIGNQRYEHMDDLDTPISDAQQLAQVLKTKYGFSVQTLFNANNIEIMEAINNLKEAIGKDDNLLIYYAGHGNRIQSDNTQSGYWLPTNAEAPPRDTYWVANEFITRHLSRIDARRVLVVADSCYAGLLSDAPSYLVFSGQQKNSLEFLTYKLPKRSRLLLTSGGDKPVLDSGASPNHSVFASVLLKALRENSAILSSPELFEKVSHQVQENAKKSNFVQQPEFKVIKGAGHEVGDFYFVPQES